MLTRTHLSPREGSGFSTYDWAAPEVSNSWSYLGLHSSRSQSVQTVAWLMATSARRCRRRTMPTCKCLPSVALQLLEIVPLQVLLGQGATEKSDVWSFGERLACSAGCLPAFQSAHLPLRLFMPAETGRRLHMT